MRLIPRDTKFFDLFAELSGNLTEGAKLLRSILADPRDLAMRVSQVQAIEHKGDKATHAIITKLIRPSSLLSIARTSTAWPPRWTTCSTS
jgi:uncharacterized protein Yka (UPF0111/DUF47 family)